MFKTKLLTICLCFLIGLSLNAQKIKNVNAPISYHRLPAEPMPKEYTTYSASVKGKGEALSSVGVTRKGLVDKYFKINGFKQLDKGGHFHINATLSEFRINSVKSNKTESSSKDKEGNIKKIVQHYKTITYQMPIVFILEDANGKVWVEQLKGNPSEGLTFIFKKGPMNFNTYSEMQKAWGEKKNETYAKLRKDLVHKAFNEFSKSLKKKYGTEVVKGGALLKLPKGKKVANAEAFSANTEKAKAIFSTVKANQPIGPIREEMKPVLEFWNTQKDNFSATDKKQKKVHHACLYNLAAVNYYLDNIEVAQDFMASCKKVDFKKMGTSALEDQINRTVTLLETNEASTRYFELDLSAAEGPANVDYTHLIEFPAPVVQERIDLSVEFNGYYITSKGDSIVGTYFFKNGKHDSPQFYPHGNTKFIFEKDGEIIERYVDPNVVERFGFNGRKFESIEIGKGVPKKVKPRLAEIIERGERVNLYKVYDWDVKPGESGYANLYFHKSGAKPINLGITNARFVNWKKSFAGLFEDCEVLYGEIKVGEYKRNEKAIRKAVQIYNDNDCQ